MIKADLSKLPAAAVLAVVKNGHGAYESVTVFAPWEFTRGDVNDKGYQTVFGHVDIIWSWRATYKMLDRKSSGLYTGVPLKNEQFIVTSREMAETVAEQLFKAKKKVFLNKE